MIELQSMISDGIKMRIGILLFLAVLLSSCFEKAKPKLIIPDERMDEIFTRSLNPITDKYELPKLRETSLSGDDLEVRVWVETFAEIDGFIIKHIDGDWSAIAIKEINCKKKSYYPKDKVYELGKFNLSIPRSGWENIWQKLADAGILNLPNSDDKSFIDGMGYLVETNQNGTYRIYFYSNPDLQKREEAKQMMKIGEIIADEFGLHNFKVGSLCLEK